MNWCLVGMPSFKYIPPWKLTYPLKIDGWKMKLLKWFLFRWTFVHFGGAVLYMYIVYLFIYTYLYMNIYIYIYTYIYIHVNPLDGFILLVFCFLFGGPRHGHSPLLFPVGDRGCGWGWGTTLPPKKTNSMFLPPGNQWLEDGQVLFGG